MSTKKKTSAPKEKPAAKVNKMHVSDIVDKLNTLRASGKMREANDFARSHDCHE